MNDRKNLIGRRLSDQEENCPLTIECVKKLIDRLEKVEKKTDDIPEITQKVNEMHERLVQAKGFINGMRWGALFVFASMATFIMMIWHLISGRISIKDLFGMF